MRRDIRSYDVAVIGAGPVGCVTALAYAARGAEVLLLEANPKACGRLAGEWLHPAGLEIIQRLGVDMGSSRPYPTGKGFVVFPDDGTSPIVLPYAAGSFGLSFHHERLVDRLRDHVQKQSRIDYQEPAKATRIVGQNLTFSSRTGATKTIFAEQIVGAAGRSGVAHAALGIGGNVGTYSRMAGLLLENTDLPFEGYGHVVLGALGPVLIYRISADLVRVCIDVPLSLRITRDKEAVLYESYAYALPKSLREPFRRALLHGEISFATNQTRARCAFGRPGLALVGDAVGHHHPLTALGMTLGFQDAVALAESTSFASYRRQRSIESRVPEMLAIALYEVFADTHDEVVELRRAIYDLWRTSPTERLRTMRFLACTEHRPLAFGGSFAKAMALAAKRLVGRGVATSQWSHVASITEQIGSRVRWLVTGALHLTEARPAKELPRSGDNKEAKEARPSEERYAGALRASTAKADVVELPSAREHAARTGRDRWDPTRALERGRKTLRALQDVDGSWEGEVVWCPMLAAQYVLAWHMMGLPIDETRRKRLLRHFDRTQLHDGTWGLSEVSEPSLFVTTLVYVASRLLGCSADAVSLASARQFIVREGGATSVPSWGKFWLAMLSLYAWEGVNPVIPELWALPSGLPIHPSRFQSHTRVTYSAMAALYGERFQVALSPVIEELRSELFPEGFANVDFAASRNQVRREDLYEVPGAVLKVGYELVRLVDKLQTERGRKKTLAAIREDIRWELTTSNHASISALSGLLSTLALYSADPDDVDVAKAVRQFEGWLWEDDRSGTRVAGARSAVWDTALAAQALAAVDSADDEDRNALLLAERFLGAQQITETPADLAHHHRIDPRGGYAVSFRSQGWPLSDATAEAMVARIGTTVGAGPSDLAVERATEFVLRARGKDGGFGSYEPTRPWPSLEWLNPAELFGDHMTERSYVECTASCIAMLALVRSKRPHLLRRTNLSELPQVIEQAVVWLRSMQRPDGCWQGAWGVHYIYGTMFGLRGLLAAGVPPTDPAVKKATAWLRAHQKPDGSWGERHAPHTTSYVESEDGQVVQTAWALNALLLASEPDWDCLDRAARFLARTQLGSGEWPRQEPHGVFFHTALLDYSLYKSYFPLVALAAFEKRRAERDQLIQEAKRATVAAE